MTASIQWKQGRCNRIQKYFQHRFSATDNRRKYSPDLLIYYWDNSSIEW